LRGERKRLLYSGFSTAAGGVTSGLGVTSWIPVEREEFILPPESMTS
jgi:hypothetical protein